MQWNDNGLKPMPCYEAIDRFLRVKVRSDGYVDAAGAIDREIGVLRDAAFALDDVRTVMLNSKPGSAPRVASGVITAGDAVFGAALGKVSGTDNGNYQGIALTTTAADGDYVEVLPIPNGGLVGVTLTDAAHNQLVKATSTTKACPIGTRLQTTDGRVFRYAYTDTGTCNTTAGSITGGVAPEFGAVNPISVVVSAVVPVQATDCGAIGDVKVTVTVGASGGVAGDGAVAANELLGGYIVVGNGTSQHPQFFMITGNTVVASGGGAMDVTLDGALVAAVTATTTYAEVTANPYAHTKNGNTANNAYMSVVGVPAAVAAAGYYYWLQTWGPCWITSDGNTGKVANGRECLFQTNGSIVGASGSTYACRQRAGFAMDANTGSISNSPCIMLQIAA